MTSALSLAQYGSAGVTPGFKNRLFNGNFEIWQRRTGVESTPILQSANYVGADRWCSAGFQEARVQRSSVTPGQGPTSQYAIRVSSSTTAQNPGGTRMSIRQKIESINCYDLAGRTVTLSFWIRFSAATVSSVANSQNSNYQNFSAYIAYNTTTTDSATSSDVFGDSSIITTITNGSLPTGWTKYTITSAVPAGVRNISAGFQFNQLGSTAVADTNWYEVTDVQLEAGSTDTPFDERPYPVELLLCQRYFARVGAPGQEFYPCMMVGGYVFPSNWYKWITAKLPVTMRAAPAVTFYPNPGSTASPGQARYFTGNQSGAGNNYTIYGSETSIDYVKFAVYNEHNAITCYGAGAWYDANAEI